jgi:hypothetical protein
MLDSKYQTLEEKKDRLYSAREGYKFVTGTDYDLNEALNTLSIETLEVELDKLPDYEKTDAFNDLLILLTGEMQKNPGIYSEAE